MKRTMTIPPSAGAQALYFGNQMGDETSVSPESLHFRLVSSIIRRSAAALLGGVLLIALPAPAEAADWSITTTVTVIETSYVPELIGFQVTGQAGNCAPGQWLRWLPRGTDQPSRLANIQAVLSTLMTAKISNKQVLLAGINQDCAAQYIWLID